MLVVVSITIGVELAVSVVSLAGGVLDASSTTGGVVVASLDVSIGGGGGVVAACAVAGAPLSRRSRSALVMQVSRVSASLSSKRRPVVRHQS